MPYNLDVLEKGYVSSRFGICCPDCEFEENKKIHTLTNCESYLKLWQNFFCLFSGCCFNLYATTETFLKYAEAVGNVDGLKIEKIGDNILATTTGETICVNNNFYDCITQISGLCTDFSVFVDSGIYEVGTLSGTSAICILKDYIIDNSLTQSQAQDLLELFFFKEDGGIITTCFDDEIQICDTNSSAKYIEAVINPCYVTPPA